MARNYMPETSRALFLFKKYFLNREDALAVKHNLSGNIFPIQILENLDEVLESHLTGREIIVREFEKVGISTCKGKFKVGTYTPNLKGETRWACIDIDGGHEHSSPVKDIEEVTKNLYQIFTKNGLKVHLERSSSGAGFHIWVFFEEPVQAALIKGILLKLIPNNIKLIKGGIADPISGKGIEIFPKSPVAINLGSQVWLPFYIDASNGGSVFLNPETLEPEELIDDFDTNSVKSLESLNVILTGNISIPPAPIVEKKFAENDEWRAWRAEILASLNLESVYGEYILPEYSGSGWIKCRDPWSASRDRNPSAGVSDGSNGYERGCFHSFITGYTISVFDFIRRTEVVEDTHIAACRYLSHLTGVPLLKDLDPSLTLPLMNPADFPIILTTGRQFRDVLQESWNIIDRANKNVPFLYLNSGRLVRIDKTQVLPEVKEISEAEMHDILADNANWVKTVGRQNGIQDTFPLEKVARSMVECPHQIKEKLPILNGIITVPIFNQWGSLVYNKGYDSDSKLYCHPSETIMNMPPVKDKPTEYDIKKALDLILDNVFVDFPFVTESDKCHTLAGLFLPFIRLLIDGPTPLHVLEAPTVGSGKSKIAKLIGIIVNGREVEAKSLPDNEEEVRKTLTAELLEAKNIILLDNISEKKKLDSAVLASYLTSTLISDRMLTKSRILHLTNKSAWFMSGNNPTFSMEIARRCIRIRIDPKTDKPWTRKDFKHENVEQWTLQNRPALVSAVLTCIQYWISRGCPQSTKKLGSFEKWAATLGGIFDSLNVKGFLENLDEMYEVSDEEGHLWRTFVIAWFAEYRENIKSAADLIAIIEKHSLLEGVIPDGQHKLKISKLKTCLKSMRDRTFGKFKIEIVKDNEFKLTKVGD